MKLGKRDWHWMGVAECRWRHWEFGFGVYFDTWSPREWSASLMLGPILLQGGIEEDDLYD